MLISFQIILDFEYMYYIVGQSHCYMSYIIYELILPIYI